MGGQFALASLITPLYPRRLMVEDKDRSDDDLTPFERFEQFARRIFAVPKREVEEMREREKE
jgi:hypothetical protein